MFWVLYLPGMIAFSINYKTDSLKTWVTYFCVTFCWSVICYWFEESFK